jgi:hypothetical protein
MPCRRFLSRSLALGALMLAAGLGPQARADGPKPRVDPRFPPLHQMDSFGQNRAATPPPPSYVPSRPTLNCDSYGRCWQQVPTYRRPGVGDDRRNRFGYGAPLNTRPPGWADDLPRRAQQPDRFFRPRGGVVCDRSSSICYKSGKVDKSETRWMFGDRASDRADDLRDRRGTARVFVPEKGVSCDSSRQICFDGGTPDRSLTRRYFGGQAAGALD